MTEPRRIQEPLEELNEWHRVLIVDDDPQALTAIRRVLQKEPYEVVTTGRPVPALQWLERKPTSLVISDQRMADMSGDQFLEEVWKSSPRTERLLLTAFPESLEGVPESRRSLFRVLTKPWNDADLKRTIRDMLLDREAADEEDLRENGPQSGRGMP
ncbi:MAG TPA: response regulator [Planctomycetota bacterium]|nr:response regulator [Planctomycetota bacterium]